MAARRSGLDRADKRPIDPSHPLAVYVATVDLRDLHQSLVRYVRGLFAGATKG